MPASAGGSCQPSCRANTWVADSQLLEAPPAPSQSTSAGSGTERRAGIPRQDCDLDTGHRCQSCCIHTHFTCWDSGYTLRNPDNTPFPRPQRLPPACLITPHLSCRPARYQHPDHSLFCPIISPARPPSEPQLSKQSDLHPPGSHTGQGSTHRHMQLQVINASHRWEGRGT